MPIVEPPGGHAIYIDAARMLPHIPRAQFPGQALAVELYRHAGIRAVEIGSVMFGDQARHELLRLAIPRRVYTQSHIDYVVEAILEVNARKDEIRGLEIAEEPPFLRHFSAKFRPKCGAGSQPAAASQAAPPTLPSPRRRAQHLRAVLPEHPC